MAALPTPSAKFFAVTNKTLTDLNKPTLNPADYAVITPVPYSGVRSQKNTVVFLDPPLSSTATGRSTVFYDRINFATITGMNVEKGVATTLADLLPAINEVLGCQLSLSDLDPVGSVPATGNMSITASATNLIFFGTFTFALAV